MAGHLQRVRCVWWLTRSYPRLQPGTGRSTGDTGKSFGDPQRMYPSFGATSGYLPSRFGGPTLQAIFKVTFRVTMGFFGIY